MVCINTKQVMILTMYYLELGKQFVMEKKKYWKKEPAIFVRKALNTVSSILAVKIYFLLQ